MKKLIKIKCWYCDKTKNDKNIKEIFPVTMIPVCNNCLEFYYPEKYKQYKEEGKIK